MILPIGFWGSAWPLLTPVFKVATRDGRTRCEESPTIIEQTVASDSIELPCDYPQNTISTILATARVVFR